jgi:hypothetical protein
MAKVSQSSRKIISVVLEGVMTLSIIHKGVIRSVSLADLSSKDSKCKQIVVAVEDEKSDDVDYLFVNNFVEINGSCKLVEEMVLKALVFDLTGKKFNRLSARRANNLLQGTDVFFSKSSNGKIKMIAVDEKHIFSVKKTCQKIKEKVNAETESKEM